MKMRKQLTPNLLIMVLTALILILITQLSQAQVQMQPNGQQGQILQIQMPQKSLGKRILQNTSLNYYQQFLGPTATGPTNETYNVFQSGRAPLQSFHSANLRHQINNDWAIGATLAATNGYTKEVRTSDGYVNKPDTSWYNSRAYVSLPALQTKPVTLFTTASYEFATSNISKEDEMRYGLVLNNSLAFNVPSYKWAMGIMTQVYRMYYKNNVMYKPGYYPVQNQTLIISGGPYLNYRFSDKWLATSLLTFDWDQRGTQTGSRDFNNNLPDRGRVGITYFPNIKYLSSVGLFSQALLKFRPSTTAFGAELALRF
ncbi:MAG: hypothetical protein AB7I27_00685 [Bacteriovoracaceae bacterium]